MDLRLIGRIEIDKMGNVMFPEVFNLFIDKKGIVSGLDKDETISSVLGKNKLNSTLNTLGKVLCWILDTIDENHCIKSIKQN